MNILIAKLAALGDVLRTTSLLKPLRARYPKCRIWWVTSAAARPLLERNPWIHRLLTADELKRLPESIRFDLVLSLEEDARLAEAAAERCPGEFVGVYAEDGLLRYTESSARYYGMSLLNRDADGGLKTANALKARNRLTYAELWLKILGLPAPRKKEDLRPILVLNDADRRSARALARRCGMRPGEPIGINPGAGRRWPAKQLSIPKAARLLETLHRRYGRPVILFGGPDEGKRNRDILRLARVPAIDPGTRHDLRSFAGLIELCGFLFSTDSLALHLATALRVPVAAVVGPTSPTELDAFGRGRIIVARCSCFYHSRCRWKTSCLDRLPEATFARAAAPYLS